MATEHATGKEQSTRCYQTRWIDQHALLNESEFAEVLGQEQLGHFCLNYVAETL